MEGAFIGRVVTDVADGNFAAVCFTQTFQNPQYGGAFIPLHPGQDLENLSALSQEKIVVIGGTTVFSISEIRGTSALDTLR